MVLAPYKDQHAVPAGPGDARPTALQTVKDDNLVGKLAGRVILVTGGTSGLGVETVRALHATGADVYITARTPEKANATIQDVRSSSDGSGKLDFVIMELDSLESVRKGVADFLSRTNRLNILITNAGIMGCKESATKDGFETQFGTNHLAHFLLFQLLKPTLLASSKPDFNSRVISVSSSGHRGSQIHFDDYDLKKVGYEPFLAYAQSKTANIHFANELDRLYGSQGLHGLSLHPGVIFTNLARHVDPAFLEGLKKDAKLQPILKSPEQGAATQVWAAIAKDLEGKGGLFLNDCQVAEPMQEGSQMGAAGYAPHAYDAESEKRLWKESLRMVGLGDEN